MITVRDVEQSLFNWAPQELAASWDNVGHLVGEPERQTPYSASMFVKGCC